VTELSLSLAREFPEDTYTLISDQPFKMPAGMLPNLQRGFPGEGKRRWWLRGLRNSLREMGSNVFHGTNFEVPYLGSTPAVMTIHDLSPWKDPAWHNEASRVRRRTPWMLRLGRARIVITVSEAVRREVIRYFGFPKDRVRAVPLAASDLFEPVPDPGPPPRRPFFLFVGTLEPRKNLSALIEAWNATRSETGADLVISGRYRTCYPPLSPMDGLRYIGEAGDLDLPHFFTHALALVYPSHYEGFGLPVLEAMQCGCPVITSKDPAITEVSGGAALHTGSALELADALRNVAKNPEIRRKMHDDGLARAKCFSWSRTAQATRAIYAEVAS